jgi:hypothetical protein
MPTDGGIPLKEPGVGTAVSRGGLGLVLLIVTICGASAQADAPGGGEEAKPSKSDKAGDARGPAPSTTAAPEKAPAAKPPPSAPAQRVALTSGATRTHTTLKPDLSARTKLAPTSPPPAALEEQPVARALRTIKECQSRFASVNDYTCTFYKRERINGQLTSLYAMSMKARSSPRSIYFKFDEPNKGREAIYVEGRNDGKILAHDVGFTKFLSGTLEIEPSSARAMENNRHPITDAGIGALIDTVSRRWSVELSPAESLLVFDSNMMIGPRHCLLIESIHPHQQPDFHFHKVRLFIDTELNLPIRFEGYDWPREEGGPADLVEEYSYIDLKINVGLGDIDFDIANRQYSFGRF